MATTYTLSLFSASPNPALNKTVEETVTISWEDLPGIFCSRNWSPAVYENKTRLLTNYHGHPSLFAFDIDGGLTLEQARAAFKDYQCMIYTSRNHKKVKNKGTPSEKPACDRYRVVFVLSEPITTDEDFKATWEAYADKYPLDPQTKSSSMFFFKGVEVVFNQPMGKPLQVVKAAEWNEIRGTSYAFVKNDSDPHKGKISKMSEDFLLHGAPSGMFNLRLFKCAVDHLEQRYTHDEFLEIMQDMVKRQIIAPLDECDRSTIRSAFNREPKYGIRVSGQSHLDAQKRDIVDRIMDGEFLQVVLSTQTLDYRIENFEKKEVVRIDNEQVIERHIAKEIKKPENHYTTLVKGEKGPDGKYRMNQTSKALTVEEVKELWRLEGTALEKIPEPILLKDVEGWCHKRFDFDFIPGQPHPAWDEFVSRLSDPEVFMAWVFSCFVPGHETRQALWLLGKNGEDGKTRVITTIAELFGPAAASITSSQISGDSRFLLSQFVGKRFVAYPDCKVRSFTTTELFRNMTGGDMVTMEFKGGGFVHDKLQMKVMIGSNLEPELSTANYDKSRIIIVNVEPSKNKDDPTWASRLRSELPAFLGDCKTAFDKLCPNRGKIQIPDTMNEQLDLFASSTTDIQEAMFEKYFRIDREANPELFVTANELVGVFQNEHIPGWLNRNIQDFKLHLEVKHKVFKKRRGSGHVYMGLLFKDEHTRAMHTGQEM